MFRTSGRTEDKFDNVKKAERKAAFANIRHGLFSIAKAAKASIKKSKEPSQEGEPPNTRGKGRKNIRGAIFTAADNYSGIAGPRHSYVGEVGRAHEFGAMHEGEDFDERPFMRPALLESTDRFHSGWQGTVGE